MTPHEGHPKTSPNIELTLIYCASGRVVKVLAPATAKLLDWIDQISGKQEIKVEIGPAQDAPQQPGRSR